MKILESEIPLGSVTSNIALMLRENAERFRGKVVFRWKNGEVFDVIRWEEFYADIKTIAANLIKSGFSKGDKLVIYSPNRLEMLQLELAVMAMGGTAVPIFAFFKKDTAELLIRHSNARYMAVAGSWQLDQLANDLSVEKIFVFDEVSNKRFTNLYPFSSLTREADTQNVLDENISPETICLNMYTSGTMGWPKGVQLTHKNILSQQAALKLLWNLGEDDRFLSYLPWHHSFGGIFELFSVLCSGASMTLEPSSGKSPESIAENWKHVMPTVFFSVPKVYQALFDMINSGSLAEQTFFHPQLKFIFTAAAALSQKLSDQFEKRGIAVIEGWGLTETSPCCTLTDPTLKRQVGIVGKPIPGVSLRIADDNEIQVKGPNVMVGYYNNDVVNRETFTDDGWYRTGDVGELTENGLKLVTRKDRIFKLSNGEKVIPTDLEKAIEAKCHYVQYAIVAGSGKDYPVALIFPNKSLLEKPDYELTPDQGCFCPRNLNELGRCLSGCLAEANNTIGQKFASAKSAVIINDVLSLDNNTLTPSLKIAPNNVLEKYKAHLQNLYGEKVPLTEEVYVIKLDSNK